MTSPTDSNSNSSSRRRTLVLLNLLFGFLAVAGQVGQNVSLPLWIDSGRPDTCQQKLTTSSPSLLKVAAGSNCTRARSIDSYFVHSFSCSCFVVIFGLALIPTKLISPGSLGATELKFPQLALFLIGFFDALSGILVAFASSGRRTLPVLQPILSNFLIPLTVLLRLALLRKTPSRRKGLAAGGVFLALAASLLPTAMPALGAQTEATSSTGRILWPLAYMLAFVPAAALNVLHERWLKHRLEESAAAGGGGQLNLIFFLFSTSCYQLLTSLLLFWVDIIPSYGNSVSLADLWDNWRFGVTCFFGGAGCPPDSGIRGAIYIGMYTLSYIGGGLLLRYAEGATLLVVSALVTPLGCLFWTVFQEAPFQLHLEASNTTWFALASLAVMVPAIVAYNWRSGSEDGEDADQLLVNEAASDA